MRTHRIVFLAKEIEALLLPAAGRCRWSRGRSLERPVHALVSAVLLGGRGLDQLGIDPEADPPATQLRKPRECSRGEGHAVVSAENLRESVLLK